MKFLMNLPEFGICYMSIYLGSRNRCMSKKFLNRAYIGTICEKGSGETVAESMGRDLLYDIRLKCVFFDLIGNKKSRESHLLACQWLFYNIISL